MKNVFDKSFRSRSNSGSRTSRQTNFSTNRNRSTSNSRKVPSENNFLFADFLSDNVSETVNYSKIKVYIRIRPIDPSIRSNIQTSLENNCVTVLQGTKTLNFNCDKVFNESCTQLEVYKEMAEELLNRLIEGCNVCVFAYGQTGSGKTHSILGSNSNLGVLFRFCKDLFSRTEEDLKKQNSFIEISFYEIYLEKVYDLLSDGRAQVKVRGGDMPYLENITKIQVEKYEDLKAILAEGVAKRATTATYVNEFSSRSHAIVQIIFRKNITEVVSEYEKTSVVLSNCYFVDLAGSERLDMAGYGNKVESAAINCSLLALQKVIEAKSTSNTIFVNYRESVLTRLLKECFGGNAYTTLLATINPDIQCTALSIGTLRFASKAALVCQTPQFNIDPFVTAVKDLKAENDEMRAELEKLRLNNNNHSTRFTHHETPCLIELFSDSSLNISKKITTEECGYSAAADDIPSICCYIKDNKVYMRVISDSVVLNGNFAIKNANIELFHRDRIVLSGMRFFVFCIELKDECDLEKLPTYECVKLEYVEGTFSTVEQRLREEARREFEEDKAKLLEQMNIEIEALKIRQESDVQQEKQNDDEINIKTCVEATTEVSNNLQNCTIDNDSELIFGLNDLDKQEKLELLDVEACVSTANKILQNFDKKSIFNFKITQNSLRDIQRISVRLLNLKSQTFTDLMISEFRSVYDALVEIYQNSAAIRDGINDIESILYGGNWVWKKSVAGGSSNILSTALYNSMCNVAKSRRSSVHKIHQMLVSKKSNISDAYELAISRNKASEKSVLDSQLQLYRINIENNEIIDYRPAVNLLKWTYDIKTRFDDVIELIANCRDESNQQIYGVESAEHLAIFAIHLFDLAVNRLEAGLTNINRNVIGVEGIVNEMLELSSLITRNKNRWLIALYEKSASGSYFINIIMKHINMMYEIIGRFAFISGEQISNDMFEKNSSDFGLQYSSQVRDLFQKGVLTSIDSISEGLLETITLYGTESLWGHIISMLCECIIKAHKALHDKYDLHVAFNITRYLIYVKNILIGSNRNYKKAYDLTHLLSMETENIKLHNEAFIFLKNYLKSTLPFILETLTKYISSKNNSFDESDSNVSY